MRQLFLKFRNEKRKEHFNKWIDMFMKEKNQYYKHINYSQFILISVLFKILARILRALKSLS